MAVGWRMCCMFLRRGCAGLLDASTPSSGSIATPADDTFGPKQSLMYAAGPFAAGSLAGTQTRDTVAICTQAITPPGICGLISP